MNIMPTSFQKFNCESCDFKCSKQSNYNKHILTLKHLNRTNPHFLEQNNAENIPSHYTCKNCSKKEAKQRRDMDKSGKEKKCSKCHGWKHNQEFRFFETCCRCRSSTIEEDDLEQERLSNSQVCSKCHTRKHLNDFKTTKKGKIYKTCMKCCSK